VLLILNTKTTIFVLIENLSFVMTSKKFFLLNSVLFVPGSKTLAKTNNPLSAVAIDLVLKVNSISPRFQRNQVQ
jgi:hypothetical protein